jgi:hypothetical protein
MCEKCTEIDTKIEHYQYLSRMVTDRLTVEGIEKVVEQMKAEKVALHPELQR